MTRTLALIATLALAGTAAAQINHPYNEVGIYTVPDPVGCETAQIDVAAMTPFDCYVVLTIPYAEDLGRPVTTVGGFGFRLELPTSVFLLEVDYGLCTPPWDGFPPEFEIGCELPVSDGYAKLLGLTLMAANTDPYLVYLTPFRDGPAFIPGEMAFTDFDDDHSVHVMHPVSGSHDVPVFAINWDGDLGFCETVPARAESFGGVKALYR